MHDDLQVLLDSEPWEEHLKMLTAYARSLLKRRYWRGEPGGSVPGGREAADFALEAIEDVWSGIRGWDRERHPDLAAHLRWIVKSKVSNATRDLENRNERRVALHEGEMPEVAVSDADDSFLWDVLNELEGEPLLQKVAECYLDGYGRSEIAERLGVSADEVTNLRKKLARKLTAYRSNTP